jgi:putative MATE family efflux protein
MNPGASPSLLDRPTWQIVLTLAWPALLQHLLIIAVNLSDRLLAGRFLHLDPSVQMAAQAAQTTAGYLAWVLSSYTTIVTVGATALVARMIGGKNRRCARQVMHQALVLALVLGLAGMVVGLVFLEPGLGLLQLQGRTAGLAADYLRPLLYQLPLQMIASAGIACLAGAGDTRTGLVVLGGVAVLNLPLAWLFLFGVGPLEGLGFTGIAVGTAVSQGLGSLAVLAVLARGQAGLRLRLSYLLPRFDLLGRLLRVSVPAAIDSMSMQIGYLWFLGIVNGLGETAAAAHGIALTWESLGFQCGSAFGIASITVVGQYLGAGQPERAAHGGWVAFGLGAGLMTLMGGVFFVLADPMFRVFCPQPGQEPIIEAGVPALRLIAFAMPALGSCMILAWALRGAGDTRIPMLCTWLGFFGIRIPLAYYLTLPPWNLGLFGAWLAMFADVQVRGLCVLWRFASGRWKGIRV